MEKYEIKPTVEGDNSNGMLLANCLNSIANELAEGNKLKKHELNIENYDGRPFTKEGEGKIPDYLGE